MSEFVLMVVGASCFIILIGLGGFKLGFKLAEFINTAAIGYEKRNFCLRKNITISYLNFKK